MGSIKNTTGKRVRVLFVEDHDDTCDMVRLMLRKAEIDVDVAKTVGDVWRLCAEHNIDLFLLDGQLESEQTLDLCAQLHKRSPKIPILFYSGLALKADIQRGIDAGADGYLTKPYFGDLGGTILETIAKKDGGRRMNLRSDSAFSDPARDPACGGTGTTDHTTI